MWPGGGAAAPDEDAAALDAVAAEVSVLDCGRLQQEENARVLYPGTNLPSARNRARSRARNFAKAHEGAVQIVAIMRDPSALPCEPQQPLHALCEVNSRHSDGGAQESHTAAPAAGRDDSEDGETLEDPTAG